MKQMTKEELIEYFIEQLGDNEILGQVMTVEQIREKLNTLMKVVEYTSQPGNFYACWKSDKKCLAFDLNKMNRSSENKVKEMIVHEFIHVLSSSYLTYQGNAGIEYKNDKIGINYMFYRELEDGTKYGEDINCAVNEGITDLLAERITGQRNNGYSDEKGIFKLLSIIVDEETILQKFFSNIKPEETGENSNGRNIFKTDIIQKYGFEIGTKINIGVKKVLTLSDELNDLNLKDKIYGLNEYGKRIQKETKVEIYDTLYAIIEQIIHRETDILKRVELINKLSETSLAQRTYDNLFCEILDNIVSDDNINFKNRIDILNQLKLRIPEHFASDMILNSPESQSLTDIEKLESYIRMCGIRRCNEDVLYKLCVSSGIITEKSFNKKGIFDRNIRGNTLEEITTNFEKIKYKKVGDYYLVTVEGDNWFNSEIYKEDGKRLNEIDALRKREINPSELQYIIGEEIDSNALSNNLKNIMEEYEKSFDESKTRKIGAYFYKDMIMIHNESDLKSELFYTINKDGTLELIEQRRRKKIYR